MEQTLIPGIEERAFEPEYPTSKNGRSLGSARQRAFARFFIETHRLRESAIRAGYNPKNAHIIANRLVKKSLIADLIKAEEEAALKRAGITAERVLLEVARLAYSDVRKLKRDDGSLKSLAEVDDDTAAAIAGVEGLEKFEGEGEERTLVGYTHKFKFWDKGKAHEQLLKYLKLLSDKLEISGSLTDLQRLTDEELDSRILELSRKLQGSVEK
jgi:phage terminase small subunit